jgi:hypothetical protein
VKYVIAIACIAAPLLPVFAQTPFFYDPEYLLTLGDTIDVGYYSAPFASDWNGDGNKDLIVGQFANGHIRFYENIGTNNYPLFGSPEFLYADGSIISLPYT